MNPVRILLADDTEDIRTLLRILLEADARFRVVAEAADGSEAVLLAAQQKPDVIVLDLAMPVLDGLEALPEIRRVSPASAIIVLSGFETKRMADRALAAGADRYIEKGTAITELATAIIELVGDGSQTPSGTPAPPAVRPAASGAASNANPESHMPAYVGVVAHELRNPLTVVTGAVRNLESRWRDLSDSDRDHLFAMLRRTTDRMNALIDDVLDLARIDAGELRMAEHAIDIGDTLQRAADEARVAFPGRLVRISAPDGLRARGDARRQAQILANLVSNAMRASDASTTIELTAGNGGATAWIAVTDHGRGIDPDDLPKLFARFTRLDHVDRRGTGLGLYITKALVEAQGGVIEVRSVPGEGSTFRYTLPVNA